MPGPARGGTRDDTHNRARGHRNRPAPPRASAQRAAIGPAEHQGHRVGWHDLVEVGIERLNDPRRHREGSPAGSGLEGAPLDDPTDSDGVLAHPHPAPAPHRRLVVAAGQLAEPQAAAGVEEDERSIPGAIAEARSPISCGDRKRISSDSTRGSGMRRQGRRKHRRHNVGAMTGRFAGAGCRRTASTPTPGELTT